jgi:hypothetical protein
MNKLKIAHHFKLVLPADDFIVTGSTALSKLGFNVRSRDLDIILVNPKQSTLETLEALETANPPKNLLNYPTPLEHKKIFRFIHEGVEIDVFIHENLTVTGIQTDCGLKLAPLNHIVKAKKELGRPKDMIQLLKLTREIITKEEFSSYVKTF